MAIVAWQPLLTSHAAHTLAAFGRAMGEPVRAVVLRTEDALRRSQGWLAPQDLGIETTVLAPGDGTPPAAGGDVHLFGSPFEAPRLMRMLHRLLARSAEVYLISEPYSPASVGYFTHRPRMADRLRAAARPSLYWIYGRVFVRRAAGVFAISPLGVRQFRAIGAKPGRVFPTGYFVPAQIEPLHPRHPRAADAPLRLVFVGGLVARKGLAQLIEAVNRVRRDGLAVDLDVYGAGDPAAFAFDETHIRYRGTAPFGQAGGVMARYDALVVPSLHDGWGVVVNEGLQAGVPVIATVKTGAAAVVRHFGAGLVTEGGATGLAAAIEQLARVPAALERMREGALRAARVLTPETAGAYMANCVRAARSGANPPQNPWYAE
ncbi:MAG: glycosyltransferase family 4 protein [Sphingomonadaceae bacterium]|nr:glycosyltransferase family 4 protein [Sphingomonadaceae bacterium]